MGLATINVRKVGVTNTGSFIPPKHRVDGFTELGTALFVDTASVYPDVVVSLISSVLTRLRDLRKAFSFFSYLKVLHVVEADFLRLPPVGEDGVLFDGFSPHLFELQGVHVDQPHD